MILPLENQKKSDSNYTVTLVKKIDQFKGLRFDVDGLQIGSIIQNINFSIQTSEYNLDNINFKPKNQIKALEQGVFQVIGSDPYFELIVPDNLMNSEAELNIKVSLSIEDRLNFALSKILEDKEWRFYYSKNSQFNKAQSNPINVQLNPKQDYNQLIGVSRVQPDLYSYIRLDLPWFIGMQPTNWQLIVNNEIELTNPNIHNLHNIETTSNQSIQVTGNDPYLIFQLPRAIEVENIEFKMEFAHE